MGFYRFLLGIFGTHFSFILRSSLTSSSSFPFVFHFLPPLLLLLLYAISLGHGDLVEFCEARSHGAFYDTLRIFMASL